MNQVSLHNYMNSTTELTAITNDSDDEILLDDMKLPKRNVAQDEDRPFLGGGDGGNHSQSVRVALDNLATAGSHRRGNVFGQHIGNGNASGDKKSQYEARTSILSKVTGLVKDKPLLRWILIISVIVGIFVLLSGIVFGGGEVGTSSEYSVPELDFTLENLLSASIGLSKLAAEKIIQVKVSFWFQ